MSVGTTILVECKQSSLPYVLIGCPPSEYDKTRERQEQHFRFPTVAIRREDLGEKRYRIHTATAREYLGLDEIPGNPWDSDFIATQMTRLDRKKTWLADNKGIFQSLIYPLAKALTSLRMQRNRSSYTMHRPGQDWACIDFYYPVVVTSAPIFALDVSVQPFAPKVVPWATMTRELKAKRVSGQFNVDVVTFSHLDAYLDRIELFTKGISARVIEDPRRFVTHEDFSFSRTTM